MRPIQISIVCVCVPTGDSTIALSTLRLRSASRDSNGFVSVSELVCVCSPRETIWWQTRTAYRLSMCECVCTRERATVVRMSVLLFRRIVESFHTIFLKRYIFVGITYIQTFDGVHRCNRAKYSGYLFAH